MKQRGEIGAKRAHPGGWQVVAFHAQRLGMGGQRLDRKRKIIGMSYFVVGVDKDHIVAGGLAEGETLALRRAYRGAGRIRQRRRLMVGWKRFPHATCLASSAS